MTDNEKQDVSGIICTIIKQRAAQRGVFISRRILTIKVIRDDYRVNKHEVEINPAFVLAGDPIAAVDKILNAVVTFEEALFQHKVRQITEVKSNVLQWSAYLERTLSKKEYLSFLSELIPSKNGDGPHEEAEAEGERFLDKGIPFVP